MKVYAYVKHIVHPNSEGGGSTEGDISSFHSVKEVRPTLALDTFVPVLVDINIPCGQGEVTVPFVMDFDTNNFKCTVCPFNDVLSCDAIKYTSAVWTAGDIDNPPTIKTKCKYKISLDSFLSAGSKTDVKKSIKTKNEKDSIFLNADKNEQLKTIIEEKV